MGNDAITIDDARAAKTVAVERLGCIPEVRGIGLSRRGDSFVVKINFESEPSTKIPESIDGVDVVQEIVGAIHPRDAEVFRVIHDAGRWYVRAEDGEAVSNHRVQRDAIAAAKRHARERIAQIVIHRRDGTVGRCITGGYRRE